MIAVLAACAPIAVGDERRAGEPALQAVLRLIGDASCKTDADCRTTAIGNKVCGGPQRYLAWSATRTDERALVAAVERVAAQPDAAAGRLSNCALVTDPGASCTPANEGAVRQCVLRRQRGGDAR